MELRPARRVSLLGHPEVSERWLQEQIANDPTLLGLGDLDVRDAERRQPGAGRLDLLLSDPETLDRYEVEIQLGATDESHIVRTIEYWDIEKRRYPQYNHYAVIVAEDITSRFLNVVGLFNGFIPLYAIQLQGIEVDGAFTIIATRVLDPITIGTEEEDAGETIDRSFWEQRASLDTLKLADGMLPMIRTVAPDLQLKYNKHYIGLANAGVARNFVMFIPRKKHLVVHFSMPRSEELTEQLEESGLAMLPYDVRWGTYRARISGNEIAEHGDVLRDLIQRAHAAYRA